MNQRARLFPLLGTFALLAACDQPTGTQTANASDAVVLSTESSKDFGDYVIHFNALGTDQLTADVARQYDIGRSRNRAILNVSILRKDDGMGTPVTGSVSASAINLTGQLKNIALREIEEGSAVYYIGEVSITDGEQLLFTIDATPLNEPSRFTVRFKKQFFVNTP